MTVSGTIISRFRQSRIFVKFLMVGAGTILTVTLMSFLIMAHFFKSHDRTDRVHALADRITIELLSVRLVEKEFVGSDLHSGAFYESGTSGALAQHERHLSNLRKDILSLIELSEGQSRRQAESLSTLVEGYASLFSGMVARYRQRGFRDWGALGDMRLAIHRVEGIVLTMKARDLHELLLQLRRIEKDYFLRGDLQYLDTLKRQLDLLRRRISGVGTPDASRAAEELEHYETAFGEYLRLERIIGKTDREGLQSECVMAAQKLEPVIRHVLSDARAAKQRARLNFVFVSIVVYLTGFGIAGIVFYRFSRSISCKLESLKRAALSVGRGHLDTKVAVDAADEIGIVADAFNKMTTDLHQIAELRMISARTLEAQENERKRVARELHDGIGQALTGIKYCLENGLRKLKGGMSVFHVKELDETVDLLKATVDETRRISMGLRPSTLDDIGITETIFWFCGQFQEIYTGIRIEPRIDVDEKQVPDTLKTTIFRVIQEAMNNVAKHSRADRVRLILTQENEWIRLVIEDDGTGFAPEGPGNGGPDGGGFGLASMKERSELSGGCFALISQPGHGTTVSVQWQLSGG